MPPKATLAHVNKKLDLILRILRGDAEDRKDFGLQGDVEKNTIFRLNIHKLVWIMVGVFLTTIATTIGTTFYLIMKFVI